MPSRCARASTSLLSRRSWRSSSALAAARDGFVCVSGLSCLVWASPPVRLMASPPGMTCGENALCSDACRDASLLLFTTDIENRTMNSAMSSVIMSA